MRTVWTQRLRPSLYLRNHTNPELLLARRTTSLPPRSRLQFRDAFLILLAPVLTTAFVADLSWKARRRKAWDAKIAEVVAEVERLQTQEQEAWVTFQQRSIQLGAFVHRRSYATTTAAVAATSEDNDDLFLDREDDSLHQDAALKEHDPEEFIEEPVIYDSTKSIVLFRQIALKMALKLRLHVHLGKSHGFRDTEHPFPGPDIDLNTLARDLRQVERNLEILKTREAAEPDPATVRDIATRSADLDQRLSQLSWEMRSGHMSFPNFIDRVSEGIIQSKAFPSVDGYTNLLLSIRLAGFDKGTDSLAYHVLPAFRPRFTRLTRRAITAVLSLYSRNRDLHHFDLFLKDLVEDSERVPDRAQWKWSTVFGLRIPAPVKPSFSLVYYLVRTALYCDQPHRAEAWSKLVWREDPKSDADYLFSKEFLTYYSHTRDWHRGKDWLRRACQYAPVLAGDNGSKINGLVFAMLEFCVACSKQRIYQMIVHAAVHSGISIPEPSANRFLKLSPRSEEVFAEWDRLYKERLAGNASPPESSTRQIERFQSLVLDDLEKETLDFRNLPRDNVEQEVLESTPRRLKGALPPRASRFLVKHANVLSEGDPVSSDLQWSANSPNSSESDVFEERSTSSAERILAQGPGMSSGTSRYVESAQKIKLTTTQNEVASNTKHDASFTDLPNLQLHESQEGASASNFTQVSPTSPTELQKAASLKNRMRRSPGLTIRKVDWPARGIERRVANTDFSSPEIFPRVSLHTRA